MAKCADQGQFWVGTDFRGHHVPDIREQSVQNKKSNFCKRIFSKIFAISPPENQPLLRQFLPEPNNHLPPLILLENWSLERFLSFSDENQRYFLPNAPLFKNGSERPEALPLIVFNTKVVSYWFPDMRVPKVLLPPQFFLGFLAQNRLDYLWPKNIFFGVLPSVVNKITYWGIFIPIKNSSNLKKNSLFETALGKTLLSSLSYYFIKNSPFEPILK